MAKKTKSNTGGRRGSLATADTDITIVSHNDDHSKFSVIRNTNNDNATHAKDIKPWAELKGECSSAEEIRDKVRRLPLDNVLPLLGELLAKFDVQQARDAELTEWIKTVLLTHTAYFMTLPDVVQRLSTLYKEFDFG